MVDSEDVPTQVEAEKALQKPRETAKQDDQEVTDKVAVKSDDATKQSQKKSQTTYEERAAIRKYQREQRKLQVSSGGGVTKRPGDGKPAKTGSHGSDHHKTKTTTVEVKIKSVKPATTAKPSAKPSPRPSPGIGRRTASTASMRVPGSSGLHGDHSASSDTDTQEQIHQLNHKLQKVQSENSALTRDKKRLETQLEEERKRVKNLEFLLAKKEAEIQEWKRKAKHSPAHVPVKKGESPVVSRKVTDSSPKSVRRVGSSGDKGTPSGSPAENRKPRSAGVTRETTSSVADTRKKFIATATSHPDSKRKHRSSSRSDEAEEVKGTKEKPPLAPKKDSTPIPAKPSKPAPPAKSERVKSPGPRKTTPTQEKTTPIHSQATPTQEKTPPPTEPEVTPVASTQPLLKSPSPAPVEPPAKEAAPVPTSNQETTPPEPEEEKIKSPTSTSAPPPPVSPSGKTATMEIVNSTVSVSVDWLN
jgi:hypothetical protein